MKIKKWHCKDYTNKALALSLGTAPQSSQDKAAGSGTVCEASAALSCPSAAINTSREFTARTAISPLKSNMWPTTPLTTSGMMTAATCSPSHHRMEGGVRASLCYKGEGKQVCQTSASQLLSSHLFWHLGMCFASCPLSVPDSPDSIIMPRSHTRLQHAQLAHAQKTEGKRVSYVYIYTYIEININIHTLTHSLNHSLCHIDLPLDNRALSASLSHDTVKARQDFSTANSRVQRCSFCSGP